METVDYSSDYPFCRGLYNVKGIENSSRKVLFEAMTHDRLIVD